MLSASIRVIAVSSVVWPGLSLSHPAADHLSSRSACRTACRWHLEGQELGGSAQRVAGGEAEESALEL